jgi:hypothetical protein
MDDQRIEEALKQYAEFKRIAAEAEKQTSEMADWIIGYMDEKDTQEINHELGKFKIGERAAWKYSDAVKVSEDYLKDLKKDEQEKGVALSTTTRFLTFKAK